MRKIALFLFLLKVAWGTVSEPEINPSTNSSREDKRQATDDNLSDIKKQPQWPPPPPGGNQGPPNGSPHLAPHGLHPPPTGARPPPPGEYPPPHGTQSVPPGERLAAGPPPPPPPMPNQRKSWHEEMLVYNLLYSKHQDNDYRTSVRPINMASSLIKLTEEDFIDKNHFITKVGFQLKTFSL